MTSNTQPHDTSPAIPLLRIVPIDAVLPHEEHDAQRAEPLIRQIRDSGVWLNPPMVAPIHDDPQRGDFEMRYVVLDGANRSYCIRALGIPHILVQIVEYSSKEVSLETWNHVLSNVEVQDLRTRVYDLDGLNFEETDRATANRLLEGGTALAYIRYLPERIEMLTSRVNDFETRTRKLRELVNTYKNVAKMDRLNSDDPYVIRRLFPDAEAVVVFPQYSPEEINRAARDHIYLPPGLSRHIIHGRALRLHYPLGRLRDTVTPLQEKNAELTAWLQEQVALRRMRLYAEATYVFDE